MSGAVQANEAAIVTPAGGKALRSPARSFEEAPAAERVEPPFLPPPEWPVKARFGKRGRFSLGERNSSSQERVLGLLKHGRKSRVLKT